MATCNTSSQVQECAYLHQIVAYHWSYRSYLLDNWWLDSIDPASSQWCNLDLSVSWMGTPAGSTSTWNCDTYNWDKAHLWRFDLLRRNGWTCSSILPLRAFRVQTNHILAISHFLSFSRIENCFLFCCLLCMRVLHQVRCFAVHFVLWWWWRGSVWLIQLCY